MHDPQPDVWHKLRAEFAAGRFLPAGEAVGPRPVEASREAAQDLLS